MKDLSPVCRVLLDSENPSADAALLASLPRLEADEVPTIVDILLRRDNPSGLVGVIAHFHDFDEPVQATVLDHADRLYSALRTALRSTTPQTRVNAVRIICSSNNYSIATLLAGVLIDTSHRVRELAAQALHDLADRYYGYEQTTLATLAEQVTTNQLSSYQAAEQVDMLTAERRRITTALDDALDTFDRHHRTEVLEPAMWLIHSMGGLVWPRITRARSRSGYAMTEVLQRSTDARRAAFALLALQHSELRSPAAKALATTQNEAFFTAIIQNGWLAADARCRNALQHLRDVRWLSNHLDPITALPDDQQRKLVMLIMALGIPVDRKIELLQDLLRAGAPSLRRIAMWALIDIDVDASTRQLTIIASWNDDALAPPARRELRRRGVDRARSSVDKYALVNPKSTQTDERLDSTPSPEATFDGFWNRFDGLDEAGRQELLRRCTALGINVKAELRKKMVADNPTEQVRALVTAVQCGLIDAYRTEIYNLTHASHNLVRATATSMLAMLPGPTTERMLRTALYDQDDRVQANAVEAIDSIGIDDLSDLLLDKLDAYNNRVRANAVHALLKHQVREAAESLLQMLNHPSRAFRISGLWLADQMRLHTLAPRLMKMARDDPDTQVRERAADIADRLSVLAERQQNATESTV